MNSGYINVRYTVYIWRFPYLDYSFDVLISRISNLGLYNWFYRIYFTCYLLTCSCMLTLTTRFSITRIYRYTCAYQYTPLSIHHTTRWGVVTPLYPHVQILELVDSPGCWSEMRSGSVDHQQLTVMSPILPGPPAHLSSFSFVTCEYLLYCS